MSSSASTPFAQTLSWLCQFAGYPRTRLPVQAERLLLLVAAAQIDELANVNARPNFMIQSKDGAMESALRQHSERRKRVHFKCDNSAKV